MFQPWEVAAGSMATDQKLLPFHCKIVYIPWFGRKKHSLIWKKKNIPWWSTWWRTLIALNYKVQIGLKRGKPKKWSFIWGEKSQQTNKAKTTTNDKWLNRFILESYFSQWDTCFSPVRGHNGVAPNWTAH